MLDWSITAATVLSVTVQLENEGAIISGACWRSQQRGRGKGRGQYCCQRGHASHLAPPEIC
jgi:hypothetical protein